MKGYDLTTLKEIRLKWKSCLDEDGKNLKELGSPSLNTVLEKGFELQAPILSKKPVDKTKYFNVYYAAIMRMKPKSRLKSKLKKSDRSC